MVRKMGTNFDSGTETLFSDESTRSASICSGDETEVPTEDSQSVNERLAPPNIQPYSGVLEKGKVVIRPIAFKPSTMTMNGSTRFGMAGERYGSTPILTRPGSRLTLYGSSNDLRPNNNNHRNTLNNYSLDRKLRSNCSPPLAMSSLSSLPRSHKLVGCQYDSLESIRKSPVSNQSKQYRLLSTSNHSSLLDLTPSPSDSGISELEAALRDRDSELAYLRQTMEHNEQVIFRVYQEKEKVWERELKRLKTVQESRLRASAQKILKLEQMLMMQTYQMQQEKKRTQCDVQKSTLQCDRLRQEVETLKGRLEETEWGLCQKTGEISLLKSQLKELQLDQTSKSQELLQLKSETKYLCAQLQEKDAEIERLRARSDAIDNEPERAESPIEKSDAKSDSIIDAPEIDYSEARQLKAELASKCAQFEAERLTWLREKENVLEYQRQLQLNYVQMYRRSRALEAELDGLRIDKGRAEMSQTIDL